MFHLVAHARPGRLLFRTHAEARRLFHLLARAFPGLLALCLLPDHVRLVVPQPDAARRLASALSAYARWRNHARGETGAVWAPRSRPERVPAGRPTRRVVRCVHLAPCHAGLVADPLAWPWSTHRDATGLAVPGFRAKEPSPDRFHRFVSSDRTVAVGGTSLPAGAPSGVEWEAVRDAVTAVCRVPPDAVEASGEPRTLALRAAWYLGLRDTERLAAAVGMARSGVYRICAGVPARGAPIADEALAACLRAVGDPRFGPLPLGELRWHDPLRPG